jgi:hypothetical protein
LAAAQLQPKVLRGRALNGPRPAHAPTKCVALLCACVALLAMAGNGVENRRHRAPSNLGDELEQQQSRVSLGPARHGTMCKSPRLDKQACGGCSRCALQRRSLSSLVLSALACLAIALWQLALWLRPELVGYQFHRGVLSHPDCLVLVQDFHGGHANRMVAFFNLFHLAEHRGLRYVAVPPTWQGWLCKLYSGEALARWPVRIVPTEGGMGCPDVFFPIARQALRDAERDACEEWHQSNLFRVSWYLPLDFKFGYWRYLLPDAGGHRAAAEARIAQLRRDNPGRQVVTVHKRFLDVWCSTQINLERLDMYDFVERHCHLLPDMVAAVLEREAQLALEHTKIVVSTDHYMRAEERLFADKGWEFESDALPFIANMWTWVLSDVHVGHPNSTIDQAACRFRRILCHDATAKDSSATCRPCYPHELHAAATEGSQRW